MMHGLFPLGAARRRLGPLVQLPEDQIEIPPEILADEIVAEIDEQLLWQSWEVTRLVPPEMRRPHFFLLAALLVAERRGSTRIALEGLERALAEVGMPEAERPKVRALLEAESVLVGERRPLAIDGGAIYTRKNLVLEARVVEWLAARIDGAAGVAATPEVEAAIAALRDRPPWIGGRPLRLNEEQEEAVRRSARLPLTVISGGPGTGKTQIVVSILRVLVRLGVAPSAIALAAPTGKAAFRMKESIRAALHALADPSDEDRRLLEEPPEPRTIHRLLGFLPTTGAFRHHEQNPLDADVVIVDEVSMVDLELMDRLLRACRPTARLVLLGDADQLPSVEAGAVLRDLVPEDEGPGDDPRRAAVVRLRQSYRMDPSDPAGRAILLAAQAIQRGEVEAASAIEAREHPEALAFERVEGIPATSLDAFLRHWYARRLADWEAYRELVARTWVVEDGRFEAEEDLARLFAHYERSRLLCLTRVQEAGTDAINARMRRVHQEAMGSDPGASLVLGEPLMMQRNDYARGLFNGDQGLVLRVRVRGEARAGLSVVFPAGEGFRAHSLEIGGSLRPSWAMTVHKSQGSEFDAVGLILPHDDLPLLTREALYTALTRARRSVVVVGDRELFARGVARRLERETGIAERLRARLDG